jgi:hypothetical protein
MEMFRQLAQGRGFPRRFVAELYFINSYERLPAPTNVWRGRVESELSHRFVRREVVDGLLKDKVDCSFLCASAEARECVAGNWVSIPCS